MALGASAQDRAPGEHPAAEPGTLPEGIYKPQGTIVSPKTDKAPAGFAHTNYKIFVPDGVKGEVSPEIQVNQAETPASIGCIYGVGPSYAGCTRVNNGDHPTGGWGAIAVVDAYDDPTALHDLEVYDKEWGLPGTTFKTIYANTSYGTLGGLTASCSGVPENGNLTGPFGWDVEEALDVEWAHTMAPSATILLVEACSNSYNDLFFAELVAGQVVSSYGGGDISNSWQGGESTAQLGSSGYDNYFYRYYWQNIVYFASSGDSGGVVGYPSTNPWVVSAGGTTINRAQYGSYLSESCWSGSGGGFSTVETWENPPNSIYEGLGPWTDYQYPTFGGYPYASPFRSTPDLSFDADPNSGVWVYDTDEGGSWYIVGGTSVASPSLAGLVNASGNKLGQAPGPGLYYDSEENNLLYAQLYSAKAYKTNFYDVTTGTNGTGGAGVGYDQCTGVGTPRGFLGK